MYAVKSILLINVHNKSGLLWQVTIILICNLLCPQRYGEGGLCGGADISVAIGESARPKLDLPKIEARSEVST